MGFIRNIYSGIALAVLGIIACTLVFCNIPERSTLEFIWGILGISSMILLSWKNIWFYSSIILTLGLLCFITSSPSIIVSLIISAIVLGYGVFKWKKNTTGGGLVERYHGDSTLPLCLVLLGIFTIATYYRTENLATSFVSVAMIISSGLIAFRDKSFWLFVLPLNLVSLIIAFESPMMLCNLIVLLIINLYGFLCWRD
jgi:hypothetical protein